jgi:hypothetical protein
MVGARIVEPLQHQKAGVRAGQSAQKVCTLVQGAQLLLEDALPRMYTARMRLLLC